MVRRLVVRVVIAMVLSSSVALAQQADRSRPVMRDFLGLCTHTIQFRPDLYKPIGRLARDYHPVEWDLGTDSDFVPTFPSARNKVNWESVYGSWKTAGWSTNASLMFESIEREKWKDVPRDARAYGEAFAKAFGPSSSRKLVEAAEIGNEPGKFDDATYRAMFENMAKGLRKGDPKLQIATCNLTTGKSHDYAKSVTCIEGLEKLYDVLNIHTYAQLEGWPTWRRSFPEDARLPYLTDVTDLAKWRDKHAKGKEIWITEFGYDCTTKPNHPSGTFKDWVGVTDAEQARYLVRSILLFAALPVDRAYIYWFNDNDEPSVHAAAGLTRNWVPKPSFYSVAHLQATLGDYRFERIADAKAGEQYVYVFRHGKDAGKRVWVAWSPTGSNRSAEVSLPIDPTKIVKAERMPMKEGPVETVEWKRGKGASVELTLDESPVYVWVK